MILGLGLGLQYRRRVIGGGGGLPSILPTPEFDLSLRKLNTTFNGDVISVRRDNNDIANIGFSGNEVDTASLLAFANGGNVFVTDWYIQNGTGLKAFQTSAISQPLIVDNGSIVLNNGKPSVFFDGSNDTMDTNFILDFPFSLSCVWKNNITSGGIRGAMGGGSRRPSLGNLTASPSINSVALWSPGLDRGTYINGKQSLNPQIIYADALTDDRLVWNIFVNNDDTGQVNEKIGTLNSPNTLKIGSSLGSAEFWNGMISEAIVFGAPLTTVEKDALLDDQNTFYNNIY